MGRKQNELAQADGEVTDARPEVVTDPSDGPQHEEAIEPGVDKHQLRQAAEAGNRPRVVEEPQIDGDAKDGEHDPIVSTIEEQAGGETMAAMPRNISQRKTPRGMAKIG